MTMLLDRPHRLAPVPALLLALCLTGCRAPQQTFDTPDAAVEALVASLRPEIDRRRLEAVLGPDIGDALPSGDRVADANAVAGFLERFDRGHRIVSGPGGERILELDADRWPFAFPLVETEGRWRFDTDAGLDELDNRRIGENELETIETLRAIVDAQREYAWRDPDGDSLRSYASSFRSDPGRRNGLYWPTEPGEVESPLGPLVAEAAAEGYGREDGVLRGYRFRMLTGQGPGAPGGELDYLVRGQLVGGFGAIAWPAEYGRSGIMTFVVNHDGIVWQQDLGDDTARRVARIVRYDPAGWTRVD